MSAVNQLVIQVEFVTLVLKAMLNQVINVSNAKLLVLNVQIIKQHAHHA